jgi:hypothetical protein
VYSFPNTSSNVTLEQWKLMKIDANNALTVESVDNPDRLNNSLMIPHYNFRSLRHFTLITVMELCSGLWSVAAPAELDDLRQLMKTVATEVKAGKVDTLISHTHAALIKLVGGDEKAKAVLPKLMRAEFESLEQAGFKMTSFEVGEPETVRTEGEWTFVLLPTVLVAEGEKGKLTAKSHTLATRKVGESKWHLLRLGLPEARVRQMLPELPQDFKWPAKQSPKFEAR